MLFFASMRVHTKERGLDLIQKAADITAKLGSKKICDASKHHAFYYDQGILIGDKSENSKGYISVLCGGRIVLSATYTQQDSERTYHAVRCKTGTWQNLIDILYLQSHKTL
jgi:hypothetical protein